MRLRLLLRPACFVTVLMTPLCPDRGHAQTASSMRYALDGSTCGEAPTSFPRLRIGMRRGYCAGLVASKDDGLIFPRSIVQIPGRDLFVVSDMGSWDAGRGR